MTDVPNGSAPPAGNPPADGGTPPQAWYSGVQDAELRGLAELKGWDTMDKALTSYKNLEKLTGLPPERLLKIPEQGDTAGWAEANKRMGWAAPDSADGYELGFPDGTPDGYSKGIRDVLHKHGIPAEKAKAVFGEVFGLQKAEADLAEQQLQTAHNNDMAKLKGEWGGNWDELAQLADRAQKELAPKMGLDEGLLGVLTDVLGPAGTLRMFAALGNSLGEAKFVDGKQSSGLAMTPDAAKARLAQLGGDKAWFARYEAGDVSARQEFAHLQSVLAKAAAG